MGEPKVETAEMTPAMLESFLEKLARHVQLALPDRQPGGYLSLEEASDFLGGMPINTLKDKTNTKEITGYKVGKHVVYDPKELREYVKRRKK